MVGGIGKVSGLRASLTWAQKASSYSKLSSRVVGFERTAVSHAAAVLLELSVRRCKCHSDHSAVSK